MAFLVQSSTSTLLPQEAMRSIVEAVDTWRGQAEAFVVFKDRPPHEIVSIHPTQPAAQAAANSGHGLSYFGPVAPATTVHSFNQIVKPQGCGLLALPQPVSTVVLRSPSNTEVAQFTVNIDASTPNPESDIEALFLTVAGIDKFMIPYLTRVFGTEYAAAKRREWIRD
jgi:hypothetical protein